MSRLSAFAALNNSSDSESESESDAVHHAVHDTPLLPPPLQLSPTMPSTLTAPPALFCIALPHFSICLHQGALAVDNCALQPGQVLRVHVSGLGTLPTVRVAAPSSTRLTISPLPSPLQALPALFPPLKNIVAELRCVSPTLLPPEWACAFHTILSCASPHKRVLVVGPQNSGKSSFLRLLHNQCPHPTTLIDIDPGQPLVSLPGTVSRHTLSSPLVGTAFPPLVAASTIHLGFYSPATQPLYYQSALDALFNFSPTVPSQLTLINAPGWFKGYGHDLIRHTIQTARPTHIVQLAHPHHDLALPPSDATLLKVPPISPPTDPAPYATISTGPTPIPNNLSRTFKLLSYFHQHDGFTPLVAQPPLQLSTALITAISLYDCPIDTPLPCIDAQYMAILTLPKDVPVATDKSPPLHPLHIPHLAQSTLSTLPTTFHGLCVIHSVDVPNLLINLYTPINTDELRDLHIILAMGRGGLPMEELYPPNNTYWDSYDLACLPYISPGLGSAAVGGKHLAVRRNIQRR